MNNCAICNAEISFLNRRKVANDKIVCVDCLQKSQLSFKQIFKLKSVTVDEIKESMVHDAVDSIDAEEFIATKKIEEYLYIDEEKEKWLIPNRSSILPINIYNFGDINSFELLEDGESIASGGLGRALVGGVLFGGTGAIVGSVTGKKKTKEICTSLSIKVTLNNIKNSTVYIPFITNDIKRDTAAFSNTYNRAQECLSVLQIICDKNREKTEKKPTEQFDHIEQIKKYKELLDLGAISQEEFETKKKQLLNI